MAGLAQFVLQAEANASFRRGDAMMNLMTGVLGLGAHLGGWRHKDSWGDMVMNLDHAIEIAKTAERGKIDLLFLADGNAVRQMDKPALFAANSPSDRPAVFEPLTLMSALAMHTSHLGFMVTATTTYEEPYLLARRLASLDHISKGRSSWNVVTTSYPGDAVNFGTAKHPPHAERYERAREFVDVCKGLWDSWADDAFLQNRDTGQFLDPSKVRTLNHSGKHFAVKGPLNVARMPQGYPVFFMAGQSEPGREFAASSADCVFSVTETKEAAQKFYSDVKGRMHKYGRRPEDMRIIPGAAVFIGRTAEEADEFYAELQSLISPVLGVAYLSKLCEMDMSKYPLDGPMPTVPEETTAITGMRDNILETARNEKLTVRQTYERVLPAQGHVVFKGTPNQIADQMEDWYTSKACDGFNVQTPVLPRSLNEFVDLVIPELQRRGLFRKEYTGKTLRENMGLPIPQNPYFGRSAEAAE